MILGAILFVMVAAMLAAIMGPRIRLRLYALVIAASLRFAA
jgi:hypothetical protein